jgi:DNA-binding response OmpR family regulator
MMPDMNGYDLCKSVRSISDVPFIMLSAKSEEIDRILGLELGSDDYISKPFSLREITIKVRNMLRRSSRTIVEDLNKLSCKDLELLLDERSALISSNLIQVTAKEFDLLEFFLKNKNVALSREKIIENVWEQDIIIESRQVDHLIKRLRKKLIEKESEFRIETVWGYGYKVSEHEN